MSDSQEDPWAWMTPEAAERLSKPLTLKARPSMETAKDILDNNAPNWKGEDCVPRDQAIKAMQEIADKAWDAAQKRGDEECAVALGYSNAVQNLKSPDKETFMKSLFP